MSFNGSGTFVINTAGQPVVSGTVISSTAFNALTADLATGLSTCLTKDGQTTPTANIPMGSNKITGLAVGTDATDAPTLSQVQSTTVKLIASVSGADTITGSLTPSLAAYAAGQMFYFVAAGDNTGAVTLNINSLGAKNVTKNGTTALSAGDIKSGQTVAVIYDGTRFQVINSATSLTGFTGASNTGFGVAAGDSITTGTVNAFVGVNAGTAVTTGLSNAYVGYDAGAAYNASFNAYVGYQAGRNMQGNGNTAMGNSALQGVGSSSTGADNTGIGFWAMREITSGSSNTALGSSAGYSSVTTQSNVTCLGYQSAITGSNQVQLGNSSTTTYAYGAVQDRSDQRDKADIQTTNLGLDFVMQLQPRMFRWDMREDYRPPTPSEDATPEEIAAWQEACKLANLTHDGTHKRNRFHQGLVAQEVKSVMDSMGVDFGGYQDHTIKGGDAVMSIGYEEMIAPLIKAIQELKAEFDAYKATHP